MREQQLVDAIEVLGKEILRQWRLGNNFEPLVYELERLLAELDTYRRRLRSRAPVS